MTEISSHVDPLSAISSHTTANRECSSLILLPVGPGTHIPFLVDTLETIERFCLPDHKVLLADDSGEGLGAQVQSQFSRVDVFQLRQPGADEVRTVSGRFFEKIAKCIRHATDNYDFRCLMRMDADALMCNAGADKRGIDFLNANPKVGQIGSYRTRCDGQPRDFKWSADHIKKESGFQLSPARRKMAEVMNSLLEPAMKNGYELGENIIAPGSMTSRAACEKMSAHPLFGSPAFGLSKLGDDHVTSLLLRALGFELADFATGDLPLAVWLKKLEWSPEEIVKRGKCITHSVRGYKNLNEEQVRAEFRRLRS